MKSMTESFWIQMRREEWQVAGAEGGVIACDVSDGSRPAFGPQARPVDKTHGVCAAASACPEGRSGILQSAPGKVNGSRNIQPLHCPWWRRARRRWKGVRGVCARRGRGLQGRIAFCRAVPAGIRQSSNQRPQDIAIHDGKRAGQDGNRDRRLEGGIVRQRRRNHGPVR